MATGLVPCLVCSTPTRIMHLGVGCRACAVFYRRALKKAKPYLCKTGLYECAIERDLEAACKRCRFDRITRAIEDRKVVLEEEMLPSLVDTPPGPSTPVLDRLRRSYETFCGVRVAAEMAVRDTPPDLELISSNKVVLERATFANMMHSSVITVKSLFNFLNSAYDEFVTFEQPVKCQLTGNVFLCCGILEETYRSFSYFPDNENLFCVGSTMFLDSTNYEHLFDETTPGDVRAALKVIEKTTATYAQCRRSLAATPIDEIEMIAAFGLEMWNPAQSVPDHVVEIFEMHREELLQELHVYYRDIRGYEDYATRLGRLFHIIMDVKSSLTSLRENYEHVRLLGVMDEDALAAPIMTDSSSSSDVSESSMIPSTSSTCLVCSTPTRVMHLGVGCRACAVFYRRSKCRVKPYRCRSGTMDCVVERDEKTACKRCRYKRMIQVMKEMKLHELFEVQRPRLSRPTMHLIERFRIAYRNFTRTCRSEELALHYNEYSQLPLDREGKGLLMMTFENMICTAFTSSNSLFGLLEYVFDEFKTFSDDTKLQLVVSMIKNFGILEETYRTSHHFEGDEDKFCIGYSMYLDMRDLSQIFNSTSPGDTKTALSIMKENYAIMTQCRKFLASTPIDEIELVAALGIELWNPDNATSDEEIEVFDRHRRNILRDLHVYYKEIRGYDDYAARIGRLYHLIMIMKSTVTRFGENGEMFKLIGVIDEESIHKRLREIKIIQ